MILSLNSNSSLYCGDSGSIRERKSVRAKTFGSDYTACIILFCSVPLYLVYNFICVFISNFFIISCSSPLLYHPPSVPTPRPSDASSLCLFSSHSDKIEDVIMQESVPKQHSTILVDSFKVCACTYLFVGNTKEG